MKKITFLVLIIYTLFSSEAFCQNLYLKIKGETAKETQTIDSLGYLKTHANYTSIVNELITIKNKLHKRGYIETRTESTFKINDTIFSTKLRLNQKYDFIHIFYDNRKITPSILNSVSKQVYKNYFLLNFRDVENALSLINSKISEQGLPFSKLKLSNITIKNNSTLEAQLETDTSHQKKRTIDSIIIKGYEKFPQSFLKHFLKIKSTQTFNLETIKEKNNQLTNLYFAKAIKPPEVLFSKDSTVLYLYIEKTTSNSFDGFLGFGTNEDTNKLEFDGYLNLNLNNNLNFGESFKLLYKSDENDQQTFEVSATAPYLFSSPIGADFSLSIFKRDTTFTTVNQSAKLHYQINPKHKVFSGVSFSESNYLRSNNSSIIQDYTTNLVAVGHSYTNLQAFNLLFPIKTQFEIEAGFGKRKTISQTEQQTQLNLNTFNIFNLNPQNSIFIKLNGSYTISDNYFENELHRFGGINSIRGFEENSLFASMFSVLNTEYRFQLNPSIYVHSIFDAAYFENKTTNTQEKLFGYGFGLGILTKAGVFKLNYANGKTENSKFKLSNSKIHLSLTAIF